MIAADTCDCSLCKTWAQSIDQMRNMRFHCTLSPQGGQTEAMNKAWCDRSDDVWSCLAGDALAISCQWKTPITIRGLLCLKNCRCFHHSDNTGRGIKRPRSSWEERVPVVFNNKCRIHERKSRMERLSDWQLLGEDWGAAKWITTTGQQRRGKVSATS